MSQRYVVFRSDAKGRTVIPAALRAQTGIADRRRDREISDQKFQARSTRPIS